MSEPRAIEASGPDIEAAISKGVEELGVSRADVIVEVLEEPARGLLGLGARQAKVRLTVIRAPSSPAPAPAPAAAPASAPAAASASASAAPSITAALAPRAEQPASAPVAPPASTRPAQRLPARTTHVDAEDAKWT